MFVDSLKPSDKVDIVATIPSRYLLSPCYYHSFGMTENYLVFAEGPVTMNMPKFVTSGLFNRTLNNCFDYDPKMMVCSLKSINTSFLFLISCSSFHLYPILIMESSIELSQKKIFQILRDAGIAVNLHYIPVYRHPFYINMGFSPGLCPAAEDYFRRTITIPLFPSLSENDQQFIIDTLNAI